MDPLLLVSHSSNRFQHVWNSDQRWNRLEKYEPDRTGRFKLSTGPDRPVNRPVRTHPSPAKNRQKPAKTGEEKVNDRESNVELFSLFYLHGLCARSFLADIAQKMSQHYV